MVLYSFFTLKGTAPSYNCIHCERYAGGTRNRVGVSNYEVSDEFQQRDLNTTNSNRGYKIAPLSRMIPYLNICLQLLHI
uniref:Uncharacterized protein n=1 Tax=Strongyloides venezuelensis TaxID=75913 RepID=A0A0K0G5H8_STRVS